MNFSYIAPQLYQSGFPKDPKALKQAGIDVIVYAAQELQPALSDLDAIYAPLDDYFLGPSKQEVITAVNAANKVLVALREGKNVLSTCHMGINRSGLISALALVARYGISGEEAAKKVKAGRPGALTNPGFVKFLGKIKARS